MKIEVEFYVHKGAGKDSRSDEYWGRKTYYGKDEDLIMEEIAEFARSKGLVYQVYGMTDEQGKFVRVKKD